MRTSLLLTASLAAALFATTTACQRGVALTTPTDPPQTGQTNGVSTPAPTSVNTIEPTPDPEPAFDTAKRPAWLENKIQAHFQARKANPPIRIYSYQYNGGSVYYETSGGGDQFSNLYAADGRLLCHPDGGLTGKGDGQCTDFMKVRTEEKLIWQDPR
ncbi:DUF6970 domain-containing protein [Hymenobacter aerophilus]|uniref:DUF6970 domain-containing protein n=1 Tax=Hymenobacter aerophilus TaxID=119644 RepID=UPI00036A5E87|nr:hypothetical protein [Hymenobacter aerophilus]